MVSVSIFSRLRQYRSRVGSTLNAPPLASALTVTYYNLRAFFRIFRLLLTSRDLLLYVTRLMKLREPFAVRKRTHGTTAVGHSGPSSTTARQLPPTSADTTSNSRTFRKIGDSSSESTTADEFSDTLTSSALAAVVDSPPIATPA